MHALDELPGDLVADRAKASLGEIDTPGTVLRAAERQGDVVPRSVLAARGDAERFGGVEADAEPRRLAFRLAEADAERAALDQAAFGRFVGSRRDRRVDLPGLGRNEELEG